MSRSSGGLSAARDAAAPSWPGTWPSPPAGLAQLGFLLLAAVGGILTVAGLGYGVLVLLIGTEVADGVLSLGATVVGLGIATQSLRALNVRRWRSVSVFPVWVWASAMILAWAAGILFEESAPGSVHRTLPPLIVASSALASLLFLGMSLRGLRSPVERNPLRGGLLPSYIVLLAASLAAAFSTALSLLLEGILIGTVVAVLLAMTRWLGDGATLDLFRDLAQDPDALGRLESLVVRSPVALAGLGCIVVFVAPAIEEAVKALPLLVFARQRDRLTERVCILLGVAGGVGFAFAENMGYLSVLADQWWLTFWLRVGAAVMHGTASGFVGRAWYRAVYRGRWGEMLADLLKGWAVHASWNGLALLVGWFAYQDRMVGVLFCMLIGLLPLSLLFTLMARWGIWVSDS